MLEKIETQEVKVDLLILQTKMNCDAYETSCRGESSSDSEYECHCVKGCVDGAVGFCGHVTPRSTPRKVQNVHDVINRHNK